LIELTQQAVQGNERSSHEDRDVKLTAILEWVRIHLTTDLSLQTVAHEFNYSREHLARFFKKQMGMTLREYIHKNRIDRAKGLLCQSDANIREIAHRLGFEDEKYFMKLFKRYENMSPGAYRRAYYKTHLNNQ
jgi:transcriptional regulator GlxA family with amidase domain